jgi:hypothetical protein
MEVPEKASWDLEQKKDIWFGNRIQNTTCASMLQREWWAA